MRTEKEISDKILELKETFLDEENTFFNLRNLKRTIKILKWVQGSDWVTDRIPARHGGKEER